MSEVEGATSAAGLAQASLPQPPPPSESSPLLPNPSPPHAVVSSHDHDGQQPQGQASSPDESGVGISRLLSITSGLYISSFLIAADSTVIANLSAPVAETFDALPLLSWFTSAFFVANVVTQPLVGKLSDIFGRHVILQIALFTFGLGNAVCAAAATKEMFITGRAISGLGAGCISPLFSIITSDLVPLSRRGIWQGIANVIFGVGSSLGGPVGGFVHDAVGWRWVFWVQAPPTLLAMALVFIFPPPAQHHTDLSLSAKFRRIDITGAAVLVTSLVLLLVGLTTGGNLLAWSDPLVIGSLVVSVVLLAVFWSVEQRAKEPIIPVRLLLDRTVLTACLTNWFLAMARFGLVFYAPVFFLVQGYSATTTGLIFVPASLAIGVGSMGVGLIARLTARYYTMNVTLGVCYLAVSVVTCFFTEVTPLWVPIVSFCILGGAYSGLLTTTLLAFTAAVDQKSQSVITSSSYIFRSSGSAVGLSIASAVFQNALRAELDRRLGHRKGAGTILPPVLRSLDAIKELPVSWRAEAILAYIMAIRYVFVALTVASTLSLIASLFTREHRLHSTMSRRD